MDDRGRSIAANATTARKKGGQGVPMDDVWRDTGADHLSDEPALHVDVAGFEGPLDLLLHLARNQKVDLTQISVLELVRQYLVFIERAKSVRIELAADYLVMAAWLAYLKSRLLIPQPKGSDEPSGEELAAVLQFRLRRLEAMRDAAARLVNGNRLGRDVFARGMPETVVLERKSDFVASLYDLLAAYGGSRQREANDTVRFEKRTVWSLKEARSILERLVGSIAEWTPLEVFLAAQAMQPGMRASAVASTFAASLEMVREGILDIRQDKAFSPIMMRDAAKPRHQKNTTPETAQ